MLDFLGNLQRTQMCGELRVEQDGQDVVVPGEIDDLFMGQDRIGARRRRKYRSLQQEQRRAEPGPQPAAAISKWTQWLLQVTALPGRLAKPKPGFGPHSVN